eukprot:TRINITY_DN67189_c6_g1_i1.p1 TRINITY_DN67189_c6_g1~~TRINITY_DN67189_c6_g1_i1.p1  ORF type:complete len:180 (-),score=5.35 TRINITY_DN67189_c6_g1_i1:180-719(-)
MERWKGDQVPRLLLTGVVVTSCVVSQALLVNLQYKVSTLANPFFAVCVMTWGTGLSYVLAMAVAWRWTPADTRRCSWLSMGLWAILGGAGMIMILYASPYMTGILLAVLAPGVMEILWGVLISMVFMGRRYDIQRYGCIVIILAGIAVSVIITATDDDSTSQGTTTTPTTHSPAPIQSL